MGNGSVLKLTWRTIRTFFGRYMALLLIVALSAGFFAGLKVTKEAMASTCDRFLWEQRFYDFRLYCTLGFTGEDVEQFAALSGIRYAEGTRTMDAMLHYDGNDRPYTLLSLPEQVNLPVLTAGRMPETENECLADDRRFREADLGRTIRLSGENAESVFAGLDGEEFTIVGLVDSPLYIGMDRGTTGIGSGVIHSYLYLLPDCFTQELYTEIDLVLSGREKIYSSAYEKLTGRHKEEITKLCGERAEKRYETVLSGYGMTPEQAEAAGLRKPESYVLTRFENAGYVSFKNDTSIISGIANIFPVFFILIAILVCMTTMTRMVDEERTQIGVLKAMGFGNGAIMAKYLLYAGSATLLGWAAGFFFCTWGIPQVFWYAYRVLYDFAPLSYLFSPVLAGLTLAVSLAGILGSAFLSCRKELGSVPARLIRPRAAKNGKRILLERVTLLWKRLSFLQKITLRNMFRYKRRLFMMLVGISCCAGLVVTAFGVRDSMIHVGTLQYEEIQSYDIEASFAEGDLEEVSAELSAFGEIKGSFPVSMHRVELSGGEASDPLGSVTLMSYGTAEGLSGFWDFHSGKETLAYPEKGEALLNRKAAEKLGLSEGDRVEIRDAQLQSTTVTVAGVFDNYIYNFAVMSKETYEEAFGTWEANTLLLSIDGDEEEMAELLTGMEKVMGVSRLSVTRENISSALSCLNYIIWMVVLFSGALAFIVIFNLTNINLAERSREIATVQVLGFYPRETESYVLRENLVLSVIAGVIGLPLGTLFHRIVMSMILIDLLEFQRRITPLSYGLAFLCTIFFAFIVNLFMKRQIGKIHMAESLKAVE